MKITVNIGLKTNTDADVDIHRAIFEAEIIGGIAASRVAQSTTELTLILEIDCEVTKHTKRLIKALSDSLQQDCIAWRDASGRGHLTGSNADKWAPFNADYFIEL